MPILRPQHDTVDACIRAFAEREPDRVCVRLVDARGQVETLRYGELWHEAGRYAAAFGARGVKPGDVVVTILEPGRALLASFVGAVRMGAIPSIFAHPTIKIPAEVYEATLAEQLRVCATPYLMSSPALVERLGAEQRASMVTLTPEQVSDTPALAAGPVRATADDVVLLQHSSGTTGLKKGVALSHRAVVQQLRHLADALALDERDAIASWLPLYHDMGLIACWVLPLVLGVPVAMMSPLDWIADPALLLRTITRERSTLCWMPNFAFELLATRVADRKLAGVDLTSLRAVINCAEPVRAESHAHFVARFTPYGLSPRALAASYAMAENTFAVTQGGIRAPLVSLEVDWARFQREGLAVAADGDTSMRRTLVSSGRLLEGNELRIVDDARAPLGEDRVGELVIRSDSLMSGYFRRAELTAEAMVEGWYHTGDLGFVRDGELFVTGRKKDLIIVAGKNIYPQDVEAIVAQQQGVIPGRVAAFGVSNEAKGTEDLIVIAESHLAPGSEQDRLRVAIAQALRHRLECIADDVRLVPHMWLQKSSSGKIARNANRERYLAELRRTSS